MPIGRVFMSGNSQAVRLPKELRLTTEEVEITPQGDGLFIRPTRPGMTHALEFLYGMSDEAFDDIKDRRPPQERDGT